MGWLVDRSNDRTGSYEKSEHKWGVARGRWVTEQQRHIWVQSTPAYAEVNRVMQELTGVQRNSSEQNQDLTNTRQERDMKDTFTVLSVMAERNPFSPNASLRNIMNGVNAGNAVNVDTVKAIRERMLLSMVGQVTANYTFKRNAQAVTLGSKSSIRIDGEMVQIDPQLLLQTCLGLQQLGRFGVHIRLRTVQLPNCSI